MPKFIIKQERELCIGCGRCAELCDNWKMASDGKSKPKKTKLDQIGCNQEAADNCPVNCITVEEVKK